MHGKLCVIMNLFSDNLFGRGSTTWEKQDRGLPGFTTGMIDLAGNIKPNGYFRRALWLESPTVYVGTYKMEKLKEVFCQCFSYLEL